MIWAYRVGLMVLAVVVGHVGWLGHAVAGAKASWHGKVVWVPDGDTIYVQRLQTIGGKVKLQRTRIGIHLAEIDAPEPKMPYGKKATAFTRKQLLGKVVRIEITTKDRYGRLIAQVYHGGTNHNRALVESGLAWHYKRYSKSKVLAGLEQAARREKRGLWRQSRPTPPWRWRLTKRAARRKLVAKRVKRHGGKAPKGIFHGNERSKVFHAPGCRYYRCKNCTKLLKNERQAKSLGYRPHRRCLKKYKAKRGL